MAVDKSASASASALDCNVCDCGCGLDMDMDKGMDGIILRPKFFGICIVECGYGCKCGMGRYVNADDGSIRHSSKSIIIIHIVIHIVILNVNVWNVWDDDDTRVTVRAVPFLQGHSYVEWTVHVHVPVHVPASVLTMTADASGEVCMCMYMC